MDTGAAAFLGGACRPLLGNFVRTAPPSIAIRSPSCLPARPRLRVRCAAASGGDLSRRPAEPASAPPPAARQSFFAIVPDPVNNRSLWALASIGCLWTVSNLMVVSILPLYMRSELGLSSTKIGALEGAAIAAAFFSKVFSGLISDVIGSRIGVIAVGALMTAAVKPMFAAAGSVKAVWGGLVAFQWIFAAKIIDRLSKGVRAAPTDALLADLSPGEARNRSYSLNQSLATLGGFVGSLACSAAMFVTGNQYQLTFALAAVPAALAILLLLTCVKQPDLSDDEDDLASAKVSKKPTARERLKAVANLSPKFYLSAVVVSVLYLARFSESFVMLRAKGVGTPLTLIPLIATANQLVQGLFTYPMGYVADKFDSRIVMVLGFLLIILANAAFIWIPSTFGSVLGFVLVGMHMSMTQANCKSMISQNLLPKQRGAGFAVFSVLSGIALAAGNIAAGFLNDASAKRGMGLVGCFYGGMFWSALSLLLLITYYAIYRVEAKPKAA